MILTRNIKIILGFMALFSLYHAAEYFVLFKYNPVVFLMIQSCFFLTAIVVAKWQGFKGLPAWGLDIKRGWFKELSIGMVTGLLLYGCTYLISIRLHIEEQKGLPPVTSWLPQLALFSFGTFFSSLSEDILTRAYIYRHFSTKLPAVQLIVVSAGLYLFNHIYRWADGPVTWTYLFFLGVLLIIPILLTKRLWFSGGMHWIGNTTFYFTHSILENKPGPNNLSPNSIFIVCILIFIPFVIYLIKYTVRSRLQTV